MQLRTLFFNLNIFSQFLTWLLLHTKNVSWSSKDLGEEIAKESNLSYYYGNIRHEIKAL